MSPTPHTYCLGQALVCLIGLSAMQPANEYLCGRTWTRAARPTNKSMLLQRAPKGVPWVPPTPVER